MRFPRGRATRQVSLAALVCASLACGTPAASPDAGSAGASAEASVAAAEPPAAGSAKAANTNVFQLGSSTSAKDAGGVSGSKIKPTPTEAAVKLFVVDQQKGPVAGVVVALTGPDGNKLFAAETDTDGYTELLVPIGKKYEITYLSLGRKDIAASVDVAHEPMQNIKLTLRFKRFEPEPGQAGGPPRFVLQGVEFDTAKATIRPESFPRLDQVVEFLTHKKSARIEISGHTDNVGKPATNKQLSQQRAEACRDYLVKKGIDKSRIEAVGHGDEKPLAPNDTPEGRQKNRRIEATELGSK